MKPIPVLFHIGPLQIHTYGIGLAITFWVAYRYFERRLRRNGYSTDWVIGLFLWVIAAAVIGARVMHVLANLSFYVQSPLQVFEVWHGGLSSWGGLIFAIPTAILVIRRRCPSLHIGRALDLVAPVLVGAWALGRLLGPQLMVAGGGHPTTQWFGMYYADQVGKRLPVPIFQAIGDFIIFMVLLYVERRLDRWADGSPRVGYPSGAVIGVAMVLWGIERAIDEHLWLVTGDHLGSTLVQLAGVALAVAGVVVLFVTRRRFAAWASVAGAGDLAAVGASSASTIADADAAPAGEGGPTGTDDEAAASGPKLRPSLGGADPAPAGGSS